ncbi:MAG: metal ABC transporter permease [Chitinispirillaceae bacterium]
MELWYSICSLLPFEWTDYTFMQNALLAVILIAPLFALPGCLVVNNQMSFFSDAIGHAALSGIAIGALAGISQPLPSMIIFAVILACIISLLRKNGVVSTDTVIGLVMAGSVALGVVILSRQGGFNKYSKYLIGDLLSITGSDLLTMGITLVFVFGVWVLLFNRLFLISFNPTVARSRGIKVWYYELFFSVLVAVIVTLAVQWIGILVINSLLILPAAAARNLSSNLRTYIVSSVMISFVSSVCGLFLSYYMATATGATIVLVALGIYGLSFLPAVFLSAKGVKTEA